MSVIDSSHTRFEFAPRIGDSRHDHEPHGRSGSGLRDADERPLGARHPHRDRRWPAGRSSATPARVARRPPCAQRVRRVQRPGRRPRVVPHEVDERSDASADAPVPNRSTQKRRAQPMTVDAPTEHCHRRGWPRSAGPVARTQSANTAVVKRPEVDAVAPRDVDVVSRMDSRRSRRDC